MKIIVIGMNPSATPPSSKIRKNSTFDKLNRWMDEAGVKHYSFMNTFDEVSNEPRKSKVDFARFECIHSDYKVVALGSFVSETLNRRGIGHFKLPHPSPRNHLLNDMGYEKTVVQLLKEFVNE